MSTTIDTALPKINFIWFVTFRTKPRSCNTIYFHIFRHLAFYDHCSRNSSIFFQMSFLLPALRYFHNASHFHNIFLLFHNDIPPLRFLPLPSAYRHLFWIFLLLPYTFLLDYYKKPYYLPPILMIQHFITYLFLFQNTFYRSSSSSH